jgi:hypothetical protein
MQDRELYARILGITDPWQVERVELKLEVGEVHILTGPQSRPCAGLVRSAAHRARCTTISRSVSGGTWTRASTRRSFTRPLRAATARRMVLAW